jgi:aminoglycoside phosphotransferase (APT) family kinase protein
MTEALDDRMFAERLLDVLRARTGVPALTYAAPPEPIRGGYDTRIFGFALRGAPAAWSGALVLRLHRADADPERARFEAVAHRTVAGLGYPCPAALLAGEADAGLGGGFLVLPRVPGEVMLGGLRGPWLVRMPGLLARLHLDLHALDPVPVRRALAAAGFDPERCSVAHELDMAARELDRARLGGLRPVLDWLLARRPPEPRDRVLCHGDFHPMNVLVERGRPTGVIDWTSNLRFADPAYDVGATVAIMTHGPLDVPFGLRAAAALGRRWLVDAYRRAYTRERQLDANHLRYYEALRTLGFLIEAGIHRQAAAGVIDPPSKPNPFPGARVIAGAAHRLRALTGVAAAGPS